MSCRVDIHGSQNPSVVVTSQYILISILMNGFRFFFREEGVGLRDCCVCRGGGRGGVQWICVYARGEPGVRALFLVILVWENNKFGFSRQALFPLDPRMILIRHLDEIFVIPQSCDKGKSFTQCYLKILYIIKKKQRRKNEKQFIMQLL